MDKIPSSILAAAEQALPSFIHFLGTLQTEVALEQTRRTTSTQVTNWCNVRPPKKCARFACDRAPVYYGYCEVHPPQGGHHVCTQCHSPTRQHLSQKPPGQVQLSKASYEETIQRGKYY